jgi:hypothetical protein
MILPAAIFGAYLFFITNNNAAIKDWNLQNLTPSPPVWDLIFSLAPMMLLAIPGIYIIIKTKDRKYYFMVVWTLMALILAYIPVNLQRRLLIGIYIPVCILGIHGLVTMFELVGRHLKIIKKVVFALSLPSSLLLISMSSIQAAKLNPDLVMKQSIWQSLRWVDQQIPSTSLILTTPDIGLFIPAYSNNRVIYGHPFETVDAAVNKKNVESFFSQMNPGEQQLFVEKEGVSYILVNNDNGYDFHLSPLINSTQVYDENNIKIYLVNK